MDLEECKRKGFIRKTRPNKELVRSLIEMSEVKEKIVRNIKLTPENISVYLSIAYDSLREILEGICIMNEYKVISHVCIEKVLEKIYPNISFKDFDRFRYVRNSINYYGKKVDLEQGKAIIDGIFSLKEEFVNILFDLLEK